MSVSKPTYEPELKAPIFEAAMDMGYNVLDINGEKQTGKFIKFKWLLKGNRTRIPSFWFHNFKLLVSL